MGKMVQIAAGRTVTVTASKERYDSETIVFQKAANNEQKTIRLRPYATRKYYISTFGGEDIDVNNFSFKTYINGVEKQLVIKTTYGVWRLDEHGYDEIVEVETLSSGDRVHHINVTISFPRATTTNIVANLTNSVYNYEEIRTIAYTNNVDAGSNILTFYGFAQFVINNVKLETLKVTNGNIAIDYTNSTQVIAYLNEFIITDTTRTISLPFSELIQRSYYNLRIVPNSNLRGYEEYNQENIRFEDDTTLTPIIQLSKVNVKIKTNFVNSYDTLDLIYTNPQGYKYIVNSYNVSNLQTYIIQETDIYANSIIKVVARQRGVVVASSNNINIIDANIDTEISL